MKAFSELGSNPTPEAVRAFVEANFLEAGIICPLQFTLQRLVMLAAFHRKSLLFVRQHSHDN